jgi:hypothetical protein
MGEAKRKRREASIDDLLAAQVPAALNQSDIPPNLNVFANMEAAWQDFADNWVHIGLPDTHRDALRFAFYVGAQAASNLMMYCRICSGWPPSSYRRMWSRSIRMKSHPRLPRPRLMNGGRARYELTDAGAIAGTVRL